MEDKSNKFFELRREKGLSQREAAKRFLVSQATYFNWETHKTEPSFEQLIKIAEFYEVSIDYLLNRENPTEITRFREQITKEAQRLLEVFKSFNAEQQDALLCFLESLTNRK